MEVQSQLYLALDLQYISEQQFRELYQLAEETSSDDWFAGTLFAQETFSAISGRPRRSHRLTHDS